MKDCENWILYYYLICVGAGPAFALGQHYYATGKIFSWQLLAIIPGGVLSGLLYGTQLIFAVAFAAIIVHEIYIIVHEIYESLCNYFSEKRRQYLFYRRHDRDLKEFSEDLTLLKEIAHENLPRDTFDSLHISDFSRNILDMYDHFLLVLVWTWIEHLRNTKRNTELFISLFQQRFPSVSSLYDDLLSDMEPHFQAKAIEDVRYLYTPSPQEDYDLHIAYTINWASKHLFRDDPDYLSFARVLSDSIKPFLEANKL